MGAVTSVAIAAAVEGLTGLVLIIKPSALASLLLGADLSQPGVALGRTAGFALLSLGWACWPRQDTSRTKVTLPLLVYNLLTTMFLAYLGLGEGLAGILLWPAVAIHAALSIILFRVQFFRPTN